MPYYFPETQQFASRADLKRLYNASIPFDAEEVFGWHLLHDGEMPEILPGQHLVPGPIVLRDGKYCQDYAVEGEPLETDEA